MKKVSIFKQILEFTLPAQVPSVPVMNRRFYLLLVGIFVVLPTLFITGLLLTDAVSFLHQVWGYSDKAVRWELENYVPRSEPSCIIVLTGEHGRIPRAVDLLRSLPRTKLIISGAAPGIGLANILNSQDRSGTNAQEIWKRIIIESQSTSTLENAHEGSKVLKREGFGSAILVTTDLHMPRSLGLFQKHSPKVDFLPYPVPGVLSELRSGKWVKFLTVLYKVAVEFGKFFVFKHHLVYDVVSD